MDDESRISHPTLTKIKNGWAALGDGWAVHGGTEEEALKNITRRRRSTMRLISAPSGMNVFGKKGLRIARIK